MQGEGFKGAEPTVVFDQVQGRLERRAFAFFDQRALCLELLHRAQQVVAHSGFSVLLRQHKALALEAAGRVGLGAAMHRQRCNY